MERQILPLLAAAFLLGCSAEPDDRYRVDIRWTSYGIPHVKANDWGSLGYGFAYATARDGICVFAREVARANGTLAADFGASEENLASDTFHRAMITPERVRQNGLAMSQDMREYSAGFIAGYNRFVTDHLDSLPAACAGAAWVRPINGLELGRMFIAFGIRYGTGNFVAGIAGAAPPGEPVADVRIDYNFDRGIGSNAIALGSDLTESGKGIQFGNPHYPWQGPARFHMIHTTIPGVVDTMGASLLAGSFIAIGFNRDIAWTHTVSTALRLTLFELELNPDDPMKYRYGEEYRDIETIEVTIPSADGDRKGVVYMTHHGPIVASERLPWTEKRAFAVRDAILNNDMAFATYEAMHTATSVADIESAISKQGVYFVNTIAADRSGSAFYADISATPHVNIETVSGVSIHVARCRAICRPRTCHGRRALATSPIRTTATGYRTPMNPSKAICRRSGRSERRARCEHEPA